MTGLPRQVRQGTSFLITSHGAVVAEIHPPSASVLPPRQPGALRGRIRIAPDFDIMPEDILAAMEGTLISGEADAG